MQDSIHIGIMVDYLHPLNIERFISVEGAHLMIFKQGINMENKLIPTLYLYEGEWIKRHLPLPDVVYNQCYSDQRYFINKLEKKIGPGKVFNYVTVFDKWEIYNTLLWGGLGKFLPRTYRYEENDLILFLIRKNSLFLSRGKEIKVKTSFYCNSLILKSFNYLNITLSPL